MEHLTDLLAISDQAKVRAAQIARDAQTLNDRADGARIVLEQLLGELAQVDALVGVLQSLFPVIE
jgi:hypothetical protein